MAYTSLDIMEKVLLLAHKRYEMYMNIRNANPLKIRMNILAKVLADSVKKNIHFYKDLKEEAIHDEEIIDFDTYDRISFLFNTFLRRFVYPKDIDVQELLIFSWKFEKQMIALYVDVQGRLIKTEDDVNKKAYQLLSKIIEEKRRDVKNLEDFVQGIKKEENTIS